MNTKPTQRNAPPRNLSFYLVDPQTMDFQILLWLVMNTTIMPLISHFEHDHFTLAQTTESLRFGEAFSRLSFWMNVYQIHKNASFKLST